MAEKFAEVDLLVNTTTGNEAEMKKRIEALEEAVSKLNEAPTSGITRNKDEYVNGDPQFPLQRTIMMYRVPLEDDLDPLAAARMIINRTLEVSVNIMNAKTVRSFPNGNNTVMVALENTADMGPVMEKKRKLRNCGIKEIRNIWINRAKTQEQRLLEHNCGMLLKHMQLEGTLRQTDTGRLVAMNKENNAPEDVNDAMTAPQSDAQSATPNLTAQRPPDGERPPDNGRGGRGRGGGPKRGRNDRNTRGRGRSGRGGGRGGPSTSRSGSPLQIDEEVKNAFK